LRIFAHRRKVIVTGYIFVDGFHADKRMTPEAWSQSNGGRGIHFNKMPSQVKGLFEIQCGVEGGTNRCVRICA
jgi:hypothetical protein